MIIIIFSIKKGWNWKSIVAILSGHDNGNNNQLGTAQERDLDGEYHKRTLKASSIRKYCRYKYSSRNEIKNRILWPL
jgi:hypothetical protein